MSDPTGIIATDGTTLTVDSPNDFEARRGAVTEVELYPLDRAGAVSLIEALTAAVEAADTREAEESRKLKRGDVVWMRHGLRSLHGCNDQFRYVVMSDDDGNGNIDLVRVASPYTHDLIGSASAFRGRAADYERIPAGE